MSYVVFLFFCSFVFFFFKQKTAYEIYQCDWSSDVCSSDLTVPQQLVDSVSHTKVGVHNGFWTSEFKQLLPIFIEWLQIEGSAKARPACAAITKLKETPFLLPVVETIPLSGIQIGRASCRERV